MRSLITVLHSIRPLHCLAIAAATWATALYSGGPMLDSAKQAAVVIAILLTASASMIHYSHHVQMYLRKGDGWVAYEDPTMLRLVAFLFDAGALVAAYNWLPRAFVPVLAVILLSALYTWVFSRRWQTKTPTILAITLSPFLFGWLAGDRTGSFPWYEFFAIGFILTAREFVKDVQDVEVDRAECRTTLPIRFGVDSVTVYATILMMAGMMLLFGISLPLMGWGLVPSFLAIVFIVWGTVFQRDRRRWISTSSLFVAIVCIIANMFVNILP